MYDSGRGISKYYYNPLHVLIKSVALARAACKYTVSLAVAGPIHCQCEASVNGGRVIHISTLTIMTKVPGIMSTGDDGFKLNSIPSGCHGSIEPCVK